MASADQVRSHRGTTGLSCEGGISPLIRGGWYWSPLSRVFSATTEKLQAGESYMMGAGRNAGLLSVNEDSSSSMMRGGGQQNPYLSGGHSGSSPYEAQGGSRGFLQDIHVPARSQRMPTPMPMRREVRQ